MLQERLAKHMGCRLEGLFCVTENGSDPGQAVPRGAVVCQRRFRRERPLAVDDRSQLLVVDVDGLGAVLGRVPAFGEDDRNRLADEVDLVPRERELRDALLQHRRRIELRQALVPVRRREICQRQHGAHAGKRPGRSRLDGLDARVCVRAPHEGGVQHSWQVDVVDEPRVAGEQALVFEPCDRGPEVAPAARLPRRHPGLRRTG